MLKHGSIRELMCCDDECASANYCSIGGVTCNGCGYYFCASDLNCDGYCDYCAEELKSEEADGETV